MIRMVLLASFAAGVPGLSPPPPAPPAADASSEKEPSPFERRLQEIDERIGRIGDLRATFEQRKHTALLREPLVSSGELLVRGDRVRWETRRPRRSTTTIGDDEITIYYPDAGVAEIYQTDGDVRELSGSPLPRLETLRKGFELKELRASELGQADENGRFIGIELTPRGEAMREHVSVVRVLLDTTIPCIAKVEMTDADGERTVIQFEGVRVNTGVEERELELRLPKGTRISRPGSGKPAEPGR